MDVSVLDLFSCVDGTMIVFGRTPDGRSAAVHIRGVPSRILFQLDPADASTLPIARSTGDAIRRDLESAVAGWGDRAPKCGRTWCACGKSDPTSLVFSTQPCSTFLAEKYGRGASDPVLESNVVYRKPFKMYQRDPSPFLDITLAEPFFSYVACRHFYKACSGGGKREAFESINDAEFNFMDETARLFFARTGTAGALRGCGWMRVDADAGTAKKTRCDLEYSIDFSEFAILPERRTLSFKVGSWDLEVFVPLASFPYWYPGDDARKYFEKTGALPAGLKRDPDEGYAILTASFVTRWFGGSGSGGGTRHAFIWGERPTAQIEGVELHECEDERDLILRFARVLRESDVDVLTGWNIDSFDWPFFLGRAYLHGDAVFAEARDVSRLKGYGAFSWPAPRSSVAAGHRDLYIYSVPGTQVLDAQNIVRRTCPRLSSFKLDSVASELIGDNKEDMPYTQIVPKWEGAPEDRAELLVYNVKDSVLPLDLCDHLRAWDGLTMEANVFGVLMRHLFSHGVQARNQRGVRRVAIAKGIVIARHETVSVPAPPVVAKKRVGSVKARRAASMSRKITEFDEPKTALDFVDWKAALDDVVREEGEIGAWKDAERVEEDEPHARRAKRAAPGADAPPEMIRVQRIPAFDWVASMMDGYVGATVLPPDAGVYMYVATLDFKSLYPSIIQGHNASPDTCVQSKEAAALLGIDPETLVDATFGYFVPADVWRGVLPELLDSLLGERNAAKARMEITTDAGEKAMLSALEKALKIAANALYGALGTKTGWSAAMHIAAFVTQTGREKIAAVKRHIESKLGPDGEPKNKVIYGDTDSVMVDLGDVGSIAAALDALDAFEFDVNHRGLFPKPMEMAGECVYGPYMIGDEKKAYAAVKHVRGKKPVVLRRGMASDRREYPIVTRRALQDLLDFMLHHKPSPDAVLRRAEFHVQRLLGVDPANFLGPDAKPADAKDKDGKPIWTTDDPATWSAPIREFEMTNQIAKRLENYARDTFSHVEVAFRWRAHNAATAPREGDRVPYYFVWTAPDAKGRRTDEKVSSRARAPYDVAGLGPEGTDVLDRGFYLERKFEKPMRKLLHMYQVPEMLVDEVFALERYTYTRLVSSDVSVRTYRDESGKLKTDRIATAVAKLHKPTRKVNVLEMLLKRKT